MAEFLALARTLNLFTGLEQTAFLKTSPECRNAVGSNPVKRFRVLAKARNSGRVETNCSNIREYSNIAEPNEYLRGSNSRQQRSFHFQWFIQKLCTVAHCPAPVGHPIAIDEMTRIDQHNLAARIACLSFWKQRCFYFFDWSKIRSESDGPSRSIAFRWRRSLELFSRMPLHRLVSVANSDCELWYRLKLNFPFFLQCKPGVFKDKQSTSIEILHR